ncbi:hypothetical protein Tco_0770050 [Tanacetum coccineum]|uniref:Uncharacterized protein n=1 Tax=Tanacetum coccineum TaxID=301880 RepID=A0ABQ4ZB46_9ASTR
MENVSLLTQKHLFITTTDKHGVPPTKRLFKVAMLDPSPEFIGPWGTSGDPGQPRLAPEERPSSLSAQEATGFRLTGPFQEFFLLKPYDWIPSTCPHIFVDDTRLERRVMKSIFKHEPWQTGHCKNGFR